MTASTRHMGRRGVLKLALGCAAGASLPLAACGGGSDPDLTVTELGDGLAMIQGWGGNVVVARGQEGAVLIDGGDAEQAEALVRQATRAVGARRVEALWNTHWHFAQTGANRLLGSQGVPIIAHENTRLWMGTTIYRRWEDKTYPPAPAEARPTRGFYATETMALAGDTLEATYQRAAHTDGDIIVRLPAANVIVAGGMASGAGWPIIDWSTGGWLGGMIDGLQKIVDMSDEATRIVPADGPVLAKADIERHIVMYQTILDRMAADLRASLDLEEMAAKRPTAEFDAEMGDPGLFVELAYQSCWAQIRTDRRVGAI